MKHLISTDAEQAARFAHLIQTVDLVRVAKTWLDLNSRQKWIYTKRILWQCAKIKSHNSPLDLPVPYDQMLILGALKAFINYQQKALTI